MNYAFCIMVKVFGYFGNNVDRFLKVLDSDMAMRQWLTSCI